jgi:hypothetical protein
MMTKIGVTIGCLGMKVRGGGFAASPKWAPGLSS